MMLGTLEKVIVTHFPKKEPEKEKKAKKEILIAKTKLVELKIDDVDSVNTTKDESFDKTNPSTSNVTSRA